MSDNEFYDYYDGEDDEYNPYNTGEKDDVEEFDGNFDDLNEPSSPQPQQGPQFGVAYTEFENYDFNPCGINVIDKTSDPLSIFKSYVFSISNELKTICSTYRFQKSNCVYLGIYDN